MMIQCHANIGESLTQKQLMNYMKEVEDGRFGDNARIDISTNKFARGGGYSYSATVYWQEERQ